MIALILVQWAYYARTVRGSALVERRKEYIEAAHCLALPPRRIVFRHLLPNVVAPLIVVGTLQTAHAISLEATLSFLGVGLPLTEPSLGLLIANGFEYMLSGKYWISFYSGLALLATIMSINLVGDRLRDILNPRLAADRGQSRISMAVAEIPEIGSDPILVVEDLKTHFFTRAGVVRAVDGVSFEVRPGEVLGLVGESGCGKTVTGFSILGLVDPPGRIVGGRIIFDGTDLLQLGDARMRQIRGAHIAMVFQDPMMTLNPVLRIDTQMVEAVRAHQPWMQALHCGLPATRWSASAYLARLAPALLPPSVQRRDAPAVASRSRPSTGRSSSSPTSRPPRSTSRSRRRSCTKRRSCAASRDRAHLDHARPLGGRRPRRPHLRHVRRSHRRAGLGGRSARRAAASLHPRPDRLGAEPQLARRAARADSRHDARAYQPGPGCAFAMPAGASKVYRAA